MHGTIFSITSKGESCTKLGKSEVETRVDWLNEVKVELFNFIWETFSQSAVI